MKAFWHGGFEHYKQSPNSLETSLVSCIYYSQVEVTPKKTHVLSGRIVVDIFTVQLFFTWISLLTEISEFKTTGGYGKGILQQNMRYLKMEGPSLAFPSLPEGSSFPAQRHWFLKPLQSCKDMSPGTGIGMVLGWPKGCMNELCGQPFSIISNLCFIISIMIDSFSSFLWYN